MAPVVPPKIKSEKEIRKEKKKMRKKWKEEKLLKQIVKAQSKESVTINENTVASTSPESGVPREKATVSIAIPGSILENAQSRELRTYLAGQVGRASAIFKIDEVVVYDDSEPFGSEEGPQTPKRNNSEGIPRCCVQLARILQFLECPQYLRKHYFPIHTDLQYAGLLNPLDSPHHLRQNEQFPFREGVVTNLPTKSGRGSHVNVGLQREVEIDRKLTPGLRVTVELLPQEQSCKKPRGRVVTPHTPTVVTGEYWGYSVRLASSLGAVLTETTYRGGYDLTIGTSDRGQSITEISNLPPFKHALIVFGGLAGLEAALESDPKLNVDDPSLLFDWYLNTCPQQGSRTIRTEEALLITLTALQSLLKPISV